MKAYKLIFYLLSHPFSEVNFADEYKVTEVLYNSFSEEYELDGLKCPSKELDCDIVSHLKK